MFGKKFPSDYENAICETCAYWDPCEEDVEVLKEVPRGKKRIGCIGDIGECHASSPRSCVKIIYTTVGLKKRHDLEWEDYYKQMREAKVDWYTLKKNDLEKMNARLENIEESIKTCKESSLPHWKAELEKQKKKISEKEDEYWKDEFFWCLRKPELDPETFDGFRGIWPLTTSDDWCGEWKEK